MKSIRRTLLVTLLVGMSTVMIIGAYATYRVARNEANTIFDYYLRQIALSFRDQRFKLNPRVNIPDEKDFDFVIRVWNVDGVTVYYSRPHRSLPNLTKLGYSTVKTPDGTWRVYAIQYLDETVEVAQPLSVRDTQAASAALRTLTPFMFLLPLLGLLIWFIVDRGLRPLTQLTRAVLPRTPASLEPLDEAASSKEVQPLILALNELLARLQSALEVQRAFIADAAHELRTPLTALQLQIQLVERAKDENQRVSALSGTSGPGQPG
ncbi:MAG: histidine kinase dimerization/phospho-acceptor domain-containing protein [Gammaproteobacteria bacterium]